MSYGTELIAKADSIGRRVDAIVNAHVDKEKTPQPVEAKPPTEEVPKITVQPLKEQDGDSVDFEDIDDKKATKKLCRRTASSSPTTSQSRRRRPLHRTN